MDVCQHSGLPRKTCHWHCKYCKREYIATPSIEYITAACVLIRQGWPQSRLDDQEQRHTGELEIPSVHRVTDHMRRNDGESEGRK